MNNVYSNVLQMGKWWCPAGVHGVTTVSVGESPEAAAADDTVLEKNGTWGNSWC